jgi:pimeloyl-ACP methyl ester carboxylesterase
LNSRSAHIRTIGNLSKAETAMDSCSDTTPTMRGYAPINGLSMYYEIEGGGDPLVYIPPALAAVGMRSFPALAKGRSLITMDLQGHGRTADLPERPLTLEQHAKDVVALLAHLGIARADFLGESFGGAIALLIAVDHPERVGRIATYGATFGPPEVAHNPEMLRFGVPPTADAPCFDFQRQHYKKVAPAPDQWPALWSKVVSIPWRGFSREVLASITAPVLIALGDRDFVRLEHAVETLRLLPHAELAVIPDAGHFALFSEPARVISVIEDFLERPKRNIPVATAGMGYHPGRTR